MRMAGLAMLAALMAGGTMAQTVSKPTVMKPQSGAPATSAPAAAPQAGPPDGNSSAFATMLEYQKMMSKEAREDRAIAKTDKSAALAAKDGKLKLDTRQIDAQHQEAREKADAAMASANAQLTLGVVSGAVQAGSGGKEGGAGSGGMAQAPSTGTTIKPCKDCVKTGKPQ